MLLNEFLQYALQKKLGKKTPTSHNISFSFVPCVNAVCRSSDQEAKQTLFQGFIGEVEPKNALAVGTKAHKLQKELVKEIYANLEKQVDNTHKCIVVFGENEYKEYNGLAANMLMSKYNKPILVLRETSSTQWSGSVRSPVPTLDAINKSNLAQAQGHDCAHGIIINKSNLDTLIDWFDKQDLATETIIEVAAEVKPKDVTIDFCEDYEASEMLWGTGCPEPQFYCRFKCSPTDRVAFKKTNNTGKITIDGVSFLKWRLTDEETELLESNKELEIEIVFKPSINEWEGVKYPQGVISEWEIKKVLTKEDNEFSWENIFV